MDFLGDTQHSKDHPETAYMLNIFRGLANLNPIDLNMSAAVLRHYFESEWRNRLNYISHPRVFLGHIAPLDSFLTKVIIYYLIKLI